MASEVESASTALGSDTEALLAGSQQTVYNSTELQGHESGRMRRIRAAFSRCWNHPLSRFLLHWWKHFVIVLTPIIFIPIPILWEDSAAKAAYVIIIIAVFWVTEVIPIAVTALLPLVLFPAFGVLSAQDTAENYLNDTNMLFAGGLMVAVAIEKWNLHKRIALFILMIVGSRPRWLLLGFMGSTAFLSMWISNTATAAMMLPIAHAVLEEIREERTLTQTGGSSPSHQSSVAYNATSEEVQLLSTRVSQEFDQGGRVHLEVTTEMSDGHQSSLKGQQSHSAISANDGSSLMETGLNSPQSCDDKAQQPSQEVAASHDGNEASENESEIERTRLVTPTATSAEDSDRNRDEEESGSSRRLAKVLMLGVAYSANIGGTATLTGTGPNLVLSGDVARLFPASPGVNFGHWFVFAAPAMLLALFCSWLYLSLLFCDDSFQWLKRRKAVYHLHSQKAKEVIKTQYKKLGQIRYAEVLLLILFVTLALLWLLREPKFFSGWSSPFSEDENNKSFVSDATTALFIVFLLFVIPSEPCCCSNWIGAGTSPRLLDWDTVQHKLPWNVIFLLGSGFALAAGAETSGLSAWLGDRLLGLQDLPSATIALCISIIVTSVTEVISNVATTALFLPVLAQLAVTLSINPLYLMIPAAVSASYAFMLPVATPPNAIAFSYGYLKVSDMVLPGFFMNLICIGVVTLVLNTTGAAIFDLRTFPSWANGTDV